jgi:hypothetical protein
MGKITEMLLPSLVVGLILLVVMFTVYDELASARVIDGQLLGVDYTVDGAYVVVFEDGRIFYLTGPLRGTPFVKGKRNVISVNRAGRILSLRTPEEGKP